MAQDFIYLASQSPRRRELLAQLGWDARVIPLEGEWVDETPLAREAPRDYVLRLARAKARGVDITAETCPHYLLLDEHAYTDKGSLIRVNPPVREKTHQVQLWQGVQDGTALVTGRAEYDVGGFW